MSTEIIELGPVHEVHDIGGIGNYYGGLSVVDLNGRYYWSIENWDGHNWEEIPKSLYDELMKFNKADEATEAPEAITCGSGRVA